ncbi:MAG: hypothetical protein ACI9TI_002300, partial [Natronomonas sp.]
AGYRNINTQVVSDVWHTFGSDGTQTEPTARISHYRLNTHNIVAWYHTYMKF